MIYTSCYDKFNTDKYRHCSICLDKGKSANYKGSCYDDLAPKYYFFRKYKDSIGKIPMEDNIKYYVNEYYKAVLSKLDPIDVYRDLDGYTLLCYEPNYDFCHRHIIAEWFSLFLNETVPEVIFNNDKRELVSRPLYIKGYLEESIRENTYMYGYDSIRAFYLHDKALKILDDLEINGYDENKMRNYFELEEKSYIAEKEYKNNKMMLKKVKK